MPEAEAQSFANHRNIPKPFLIVALVLAIDVIVRIWYLIQTPSLNSVWSVLVGMALVFFCFVARRMALINQDRLIRLEMRLRLERVLGAEKRAAIQNLSLGQLIALRFASDAELPGLVDAVIAEKLTKQSEIKTRIKDWQADWLRV